MNASVRLPVVFTAQSKVFFYCRDAVCEFVFKRNAIPVNPFRVFEYFLGDRVDRNLVRQGNNNLIHVVDELWVFGETIADGVLSEIFLAKVLRKPICFFTIDNRADKIREITSSRLYNHLHFEQQVYKTYRLSREKIIAKIIDHPADQAEQLNLFDKMSDE